MGTAQTKATGETHQRKKASGKILDLSLDLRKRIAKEPSATCQRASWEKGKKKP